MTNHAGSETWSYLRFLRFALMPCLTPLQVSYVNTPTSASPQCTQAQASMLPIGPATPHSAVCARIPCCRMPELRTRLFRTAGRERESPYRIPSEPHLASRGICFCHLAYTQALTPFGNCQCHIDEMWAASWVELKSGSPKSLWNKAAAGAASITAAALEALHKSHYPWLVSWQILPCCSLSFRAEKAPQLLSWIESHGLAGAGQLGKIWPILRGEEGKGESLSKGAWRDSAQFDF